MKKEADKKKEIAAKQQVQTQRRKAGIKKKNQFMQILDSVEYKGLDVIPAQEYHLGDEEIKLRKAFKLYDKKLKKKDRKKTEKFGVAETKKEENQNDDKQKKKSKKPTKEGEEDKDEKEEEKKAELIEGETPHIDEDEEDENQEAQSSITSGSTGSSVRMSYSLRAAIDEKFIPRSIRNLRIGADLLFLLLLALAIIFFALQNTLYSSLISSIKNIRYCENRVNVMLDITLKVRELSFLSLDNLLHQQNPSLPDSKGLIWLSTNDKKDKYKLLRSDLISLASELKNAQYLVSLEASKVSMNTLKKVNGDSFNLSSLPVPKMPLSYSYILDQAIMEVVVSGFHIANLTYSQILPSEASVYFIQENTLNNILVSLERSTSAIVDDNSDMRENSWKIFIILLSLASAALVVATALLIPVVTII